MAEGAERSLKVIAALRDKFRASLPGQLESIASLVELLGEQSAPAAIRPAAAKLGGHAHKLAGSAGTFGYQKLGRTARSLDLICEQLAKLPRSPDKEVLAQVVDLAEQLKADAEDLEAGDQLKASPHSSFLASLEKSMTRDVVVVDDDVAFGGWVAQQLADHGFRVHYLEALDDARLLLQDIVPAMVLMDLEFPGHKYGGIETVNELREIGAITCPVVYLTVRDDATARLAAVRSGGAGYLAKPVTTDALVETVKMVSRDNTRDPFRVLVIDDDEVQADYISALLEGFGARAARIIHPMDILEPLRSLQPDIILSDIDMPGCSGFELAELIRQVPGHSETPIVFLTSREGRESQMDGLQAGGDGLLTKPVRPDLLVEAVFSRARRYRMWRDAQQALAASRDQYEALVSSAPDAVISVDQDGSVIHWNRGAQRIFGYAPEEVLGDPITSLVTDPYKREFDDARRILMETTGTCGTSASLREMVGVTRTGGKVPVEVAMSDWDFGNAKCLTAIFRDISQRKEAQRKLGAAAKQAEAANRAKSEFLAKMSHELRTPLNAIIGFSDMLVEDVAEMDLDYMADPVNRISRAGKHLLGLINDILDMSKIEAGMMTLNIEKFDALPVLHDMEKVAQALAQKNNSTLTFACDVERIVIQSDIVRFRQIVTNLLSNACKFTRDGEIEIDAELRQTDGGEELKVSVSDTGIGMSEEQLGRLFQDFVQADETISERFGGTGLGLSICKKLTELLGGTISVTSVLGKGSTFAIRMPTTRDHRSPT